ncbi:MAG TPA: efflux RND transporter permease subunit [Candidatus Paceibacterota bacterium]|nr:efflux RND transporter permease subunit [Candidatus Paceibacterota bacterium]
MLWLWNFFLERRQFSYMLIGTLIFAGAFAVFAIPKENYPAITIPYGIVVTLLPGASAADVETLVTDKLEDQISNLSNLDTVTSQSMNGVSEITVQFDANADITTSIQDLRDAVAQAAGDLPSDATTPTVTKLNFEDQPVIVASVVSDLPQTELSALGTKVSDQLKALSGVSKVDVTGVPDRQVSVIVSKQALAQHGLSLSDVTQAIAGSNTALPAGTITMDGVNYDVNFKGGLTDPAELQDVTVGTSGGAPIYLRDIALISDGLAPASTYSRVSIAGEPSNQAITFDVYKQSGASIQGVADEARQELAALQEDGGLLAGAKVFVAPSTDQGAQVSQSLGDLTKTGFETVLLVLLMLFLTIGWRESIVAALSIPLSFVIAFVGLYATGNTLNFISLFALILAVGILVDSGIVVTEAIHARMRIYHDPMKAAKHALADYAWPLIAGTMVTVAVFAPLFFISGIVGQFIAGIPYTLIFVLLASIFVALGIVPLIAILFSASDRHNRLEQLQERYTDRITEWYKRMLGRLLASRRAQNWFLSGIAALFVISLFLPMTGLVQSIFFPQDDSDYVIVSIEKPQGTVLATTDLAVREVEELLYQDKEIASFQTTVGAGSALGGFGGGGMSGNEANITVNLKKPRDVTSTQEVARLQHLLAPVKDATIQVTQPSEGPSTGAPIQIELKGSNLDDLVTAADKAEALLASIPHTVNVDSSTKSTGTELDLTIDRAKAAVLGVSPLTIAQTLRTAINGTKATTINEPGQDIDVIVQLDLNSNYTSAADTADATLDAVKNIQVPTTHGTTVLLGSVLSDALAPSNATIAHKDKVRLETVSAYPDDTTTAGVIVAEFQKKAASLDLPAGVTIDYGGESEDIGTSFTQMFVALLAGFALMFMILVLAFNSFRYTFYLLMIVPLSLIGVLDGLALTGQPLSFPSMLGFIALGGVIINHAIILMDSMIRHLAASPETPIEDIVIDSAATRLRPIALTTIATVLGMIPLSGSSAMWSPLAFTIMFGLSFAIVLTLALIPTIFYRSVVRKRAKQAGIWERRHPLRAIGRLIARPFRRS